MEFGLYPVCAFVWVVAFRVCGCSEHLSKDCKRKFHSARLDLLWCSGLADQTTCPRSESQDWNQWCFAASFLHSEISRVYRWHTVIGPVRDTNSWLQYSVHPIKTLKVIKRHWLYQTFKNSRSKCPTKSSIKIWLRDGTSLKHSFTAANQAHFASRLVIIFETDALGWNCYILGQEG